MKIRKTLITTCVILVYGQSAMGQSRIVVCDATTKAPIPYTNAYKAEKGEYRGTATDEKGIATIDFSFQKLCISHVGYIQQTFTNTPDTVFLIPKENLLSEVVVSNAEPQWIRPFLKRFVENKKDKYLILQMLSSFLTIINDTVLRIEPNGAEKATRIALIAFSANTDNYHTG